MSLAEELLQLETKAKLDLEQAKAQDEFEKIKLKYLSRKGLLAELSSQIKSAPPEEKKAVGQAINEAKKALTELFDKPTSEAKVSLSKNDLTMPGTAKAIGGLHPITQTVHDIVDIFKSLGFGVAEGPEMESGRNNFDALNVPPNHPSRDEVDTFYLENAPKEKGHLLNLLRTQTSTVQIRYMDENKPPIKIVSPGKVYRPDATDATHSFMFHQIEGLLVDENVSFAELKGVLMAFAKAFFGENTLVRFRPHHFPFTEPSAEMDVSCDLWGKEGGSSAKKNWLEILGAGMVHPNVLKSVGINPKKYSGFAFGVGVERMAMLRWGVKDIRYFYENDMRFLKQF